MNVPDWAKTHPKLTGQTEEPVTRKYDITTDEFTDVEPPKVWATSDNVVLEQPADVQMPPSASPGTLDPALRTSDTSPSKRGGRPKGSKNKAKP